MYNSTMETTNTQDPTPTTLTHEDMEMLTGHPESLYANLDLLLAHGIITSDELMKGYEAIGTLFDFFYRLPEE